MAVAEGGPASYPVAYFLMAKTTGMALSNLVQDMLISSGLNGVMVTAVIGDGATSNRAAHHVLNDTDLMKWATQGACMGFDCRFVYGFRGVYCVLFFMVRVFLFRAY